MKNLHVPCSVYFSSLFINVYFYWFYIPFFAGVGPRKVHGKTDPLWAQQEACLPSDVQCSGIDTKPELDTGKTPARRWSYLSLMPNHTHSVLVLMILSGPHGSHVRKQDCCLCTVKGPHLRWVSMSPGAIAATGSSQSPSLLHDGTALVISHNPSLFSSS